MQFNIPKEIQSTYKGANEVMGAASNDARTVFHLWTYHGLHDRWALQGDVWVKTYSVPG